MENDSVKIYTTIHAPVEMVWKAWTDPDLILKWFGSDPQGWGFKAVLDPRPEGNFEISFCNSDGTEFTCHGRYAEVEKPKKLAFTWEWKNEPGVESFVTLLFSPENNHTRMQFEHAHVGTASAHNYLEGWKSTFAKLDRLLSGNPEADV